MLLHIFDVFKTIGQINFKLGGEVPWVGSYHDWSNGHGPVIFGFFMIFLLIFWPKTKKSLSLYKLSQLLLNCIEKLLGMRVTHVQ